MDLVSDMERDRKIKDQEISELKRQSDKNLEDLIRR